MKLPRLLRPLGNRVLTPLGQPDSAERLLAEAFRTLGSLCTRMADLVEAQRLSRAGYSGQGRFLERLDLNRPAASPRQGGDSTS
jgi:hypothetical protein